MQIRRYRGLIPGWDTWFSSWRKSIHAQAYSTYYSLCAFMLYLVREPPSVFLTGFTDTTVTLSIEKSSCSQSKAYVYGFAIYFSKHIQSGKWQMFWSRIQSSCVGLHQKSNLRKILSNLQQVMFFVLCPCSRYFHLSCISLGSAILAIPN